MKISVIGTGYVGLVSGACFAELGIDVVCVDINEQKVEELKKGIIPIYEPGLEDIVLRQTAAKRLSFTVDTKSAVTDSEAVFIAVGTPPREDGYADLSYVYKVAKQIAKNLNGYTLVVTKSTVPVGTAQEIKRIILEQNPNADFDVVSNPEFLREGSAVKDFMHPDRILIGCETQRARDVMGALYSCFSKDAVPILYTTPETSEISKYAANAFLAMKITFINEIADLCEQTGGNVQEVSKALGMDARIGKGFLNAGPGYGGSCFPKDTRALTQNGRLHNAPQTIIEQVMAVNYARQAAMADRVVQACGGDIKGKRVGILGVAFKPETNDVREAPSLVIIDQLQAAGAIISAYDPIAMEEAKKVLQDVNWCDNSYDAAKDSDILVIVTEWSEFKTLNMSKVKAVMKRPCILDLRNIYQSEDMAQLGFNYYAIGKSIPNISSGEKAVKKLA